MEMTTDHLELLYRAKLLGTNCGQVLEPIAYPEAGELEEVGWLRRELLPNGDVGWYLTAEGETAIDLASLTANYAGQQN